MEDKTPKNWIDTKLGNITTKPQYGWTSKAGNEGKVKYLRTTDLSKGNVDWNSVPFCIKIPDSIAKYQVEKNDILISRAGSVGLSYRIEFAPKNTVFASYLIRFKPLISAKLVEYYLKSKEYWNAISDVSAGIAVQNINATKLADLNFPLPPRAEQHRIVAKLDTLFAQLEQINKSLEHIPTLLENFRQQVLTQAVTGKLTEEWRATQVADLEAVKADFDNLKAIKKNENKKLDLSIKIYSFCKDWLSVKPNYINDISQHSLGIGPFGSNLKVVDYKESGYPLIFVRNIKANDFTGQNPKFISEKKFNELKAHSVRGNDLLITKMGDPPGDCEIYPEELKDGIITSDCLKFRLLSNCNLKFYKYVINSSIVKTQLLGITKGVAQQKLSLKRFKTIDLPFPAFKEQQEIVNRVENLFAKADAIEAHYAALKTKIEHLPQAILHKAFKGELVPQLESDGDARELLKEIEGLKNK